jgi:hypothetical protein
MTERKERETSANAYVIDSSPARRLEHWLALLGCHHVDTTRYSGHALAPTIWALRLRCLML